MSELQLFHALGALAALSAAATVTLARSVMASSLCLGSTALALAGLFTLLGAPMLAVVYAIVGAGSVMLLVAFLMTLLEAGGGGARMSARTPARGLVKAAGAVAVLALAWLLGRVLRLSGVSEADEAGGVGGARALGRALFGDHLVAVEIMGLVLLAALIASAVLVRQRDPAAPAPAGPETGDEP